MWGVVTGHSIAWWFLFLFFSPWPQSKSITSFVQRKKTTRVEHVCVFSCAVTGHVCRQAAEVCFWCRPANNKARGTLFGLIARDSSEMEVKTKLRKVKTKNTFFVKFMTDLMWNTAMIIRPAILSLNSSLITVWHLLEESLVYSCLTPKPSFFSCLNVSFLVPAFEDFFLL